MIRTTLAILIGMPLLHPRRLRTFLTMAFVSLLVVGCQPSQPAQSGAPKQEESSVAELVPTGAGYERCPAPVHARVKRAVVVVRVMVLADGTPQHVEVTKSSVPDQGFEEAARTCAMKYRYRPAQDAHREARRGWSHEFNVTFVDVDAAASTILSGR